LSNVDVAILDYGVGNLHSIRKAFEHHGATPRIVSNPADLANADGLVLPGVGAWGDAAKRVEPFREELLYLLTGGKPLLGICLGYQLLFEASEEDPGINGLGYFRGTTRRLHHAKLPHIGWNTLSLTPDDLFDGLSDGCHVYYVNSFAPAPEEPVTIATTTYGATFTAAVRKRSTWGVQFHPEKSGAVGLRMIENFVRYVKENA